MKLNALLLAFALCAAPAAACAQNINPSPAQSASWTLSVQQPAPVSHAVQMAEDLSNPVISPDGKRVLMFKRGLPGEPGELHEWNETSASSRQIIRDQDLSMFVSWQNDGSFVVRENSRPFFKSGETLHFSKKNTKLGRIARSEAKISAYDDNDTIMLHVENAADTAISRPGEHCFAPMVSPDNRFVVFSCLKTGIQLYDTQSGHIVATVRGTSPAFSNDGRYLVYASTRDDGHQVTQGDIHLIDLQKRTTRMIANPDAEIRTSATISEAADRIAYETADGRAWIAELSVE